MTFAERGVDAATEAPELVQPPCAPRKPWMIESFQPDLQERLLLHKARCDAYDERDFIAP